MHLLREVRINKHVGDHISKAATMIVDALFIISDS